MSRERSANERANSCTAFWFPRTRFTGSTSPSSIARIGLMFRRLPANAAALPIRPPFCRNSSVSTVKRRFAPLVEVGDEFVDLLVGRPALESPLDRHCSIVIAADAVSVSTTRTLSPQLAGRRARALERAGELRGDLQRVDALVSGELLVRPRESRRASAATSSATPSPYGVARRTPPARSRRSRAGSPRRSGRRAGPCASSRSAPAPGGSPRSSRARPPCCRPSSFTRARLRGSPRRSPRAPCPSSGRRPRPPRAVPASPPCWRTR